MASKAKQIATDLIIRGLGGLADLGQHGVALLFPLGINQADTHVLLHLGQRDQLARDRRDYRTCGGSSLLLRPAKIEASVRPCEPH